MYQGLTLEDLEVLEVGIFCIHVEFNAVHRHVLCSRLKSAILLEVVVSEEDERKMLS